ncbi:MAG: pseudaminic acid cytidylyltransferase [Desulfobacteraceae bacterium]|nr:pseudaminic acid cytidylyltransferase [Desulfobacteraceae bacterium]
MNVAIIPARGGSKRIPGKNIKNFAGKPIITYSIEAAKASGIFDRIIVSTDSEDITDVARSAGAEVPFARPSELSDDHTPTAPVLEHALSWLESEGCSVKYLCCIYPTAPFVRSEDLIKGYKLLVESNVSSVFSVTKFEFTIFRGLKINDEGFIEMFWPEHELTRSQDLPQAYHDAGQFYWLDSEKFLGYKRLYAKDAKPIILPRVLVQDIDTPEDWEIAEIMYQMCKEKELL